MNDLHPSFGPVPEHEFRRAEAAPFGSVANILRKYAPAFGLSTDAVPSQFRVKVTRDVTCSEKGFVTVEAYSSEEAEALVGNMSCEQIAWTYDFDNHQAESSFMIDEIEECK